MATTPTQQMPANPQLYNPQTFGIQSQQAQGSGVVPPTNNPATPVSFASPTTVATAPALDPMPETDITANFKKPTHQTGSAPPPFNPAVVNSGPRHSPPPAVDQPNGNDQQPTTNTANNPPQQQLRGKRILQPEPKNPALASRSPTLSEYGGHMPHPIASPAVSRNVNSAVASPAPKPEWESDPAYVSTTLKSWPASTDVLDKTGLPFCITFHPLAETGKEVPVINFGDANIIRCKRCRTYVNPYVAFIDGGKRWKCNICYFLNDVPREYFSIVGIEGFRYDHAERPELNNSVVEFVASPEFMHRPPQPPVYFFVIDVSYSAVASGMVQAVCNSILQAIEQKLSKNERTKIGFVTFDSTIHFYNLRSGLNSPQMLVVPEVETPFTPNPEDLLVNLQDSMPLVKKLLTSLLPELFNQTQETTSALGPALHAAYKVMASQGGKLTVFQTVLPSVGAGKLPNRQNTNSDATQRTLLQPGEQYYKNLSLELSKCQIGCDLFFFAPSYVDVATIGCLSKFTGGEINTYTLDQHNVNEASRLQNDLYRTLTRNNGFEALMRVRCSKGLCIDSHHGSFFLRAQDLMTLPNVDSDKSFTLKLKINDPKNYMTAKNLGRDGRYYATVQAGLLYTTSNGERRIRVITKCCPITDQTSDLYRDVDEKACSASIGKLAVHKAIEEGLPKAVAALKSSCSNILSKYARFSGSGQSGGQTLMLPNTMLHFPLYTLATIKNAMFRSDTPIDRRVTLMRRFETLSDTEATLWIHPNLYNLAALGDGVGEMKEPFVMLATLELTSERLDQRGIFLLDDGLAFILWVGSAVDPSMLQAVFGIQSLAEVDANNSQLQIFRRENEYSQRVNNIVDRLRSGRTGYTWMYPMKEKDPTERKFFSKLIQDRFPDSYSYREFIVEMKNSANQRR